MRSFEIGQRVKVRRCDFSTGSINRNSKATVVEFRGNEAVKVKWDDGSLDSWVLQSSLIKLYKVDRGVWKKGSKVKVYGITERLESDYKNGMPCCYRRGDKATVVEALSELEQGDYEVTVQLDKGGILVLHSQQLRLITDET